MAKDSAQRYKDVPLKMVGGTHFGRYNKISVEQTYNMLLSDDALVPFAGYKLKIPIDPNGTGRAIYASTKNNRMLAVIDSTLYVIYPMLNYVAAIGSFATSAGDIFLAENNNRQVLFSDYQYLYYYSYDTNVLTTLTSLKNADPNLGIQSPGYITFQNGRFVVPDMSTNFWYISGANSMTQTTFSSASQFQGELSTKPDTCQACVRFPGKGNLLLVMGNVVTEQWQDIGAQLFPYQRTTYANIDYGCLNPTSIDENEDLVCWVAGNEKSGPFIAFSDGKQIKRISNDGIDFKLANLTDPTNVYGYLFRQDGHLIYVATWPTDGLSYAYDFNTQEFSTLTSEKMGAYIAKDVSYFNGNYYFVSTVDGNIYQMGSNLYTYDYGNGNVYEIPRIRITPPIRMPDQSRFVAGYAGFTIEQGQFNYDDRDTRFILGDQMNDPICTQGNSQYIGGGFNFATNVPRVDLSLSKDGGVNFGSDVSINMRPQGVRQNRLMWWRLGAQNDLTMQFKFYGFDHFTMTEGICGVYN